MKRAIEESQRLEEERQRHLLKQTTARVHALLVLFYFYVFLCNAVLAVFSRDGIHTKLESLLSKEPNRARNWMLENKTKNSNQMHAVIEPELSVLFK